MKLAILLVLALARTAIGYQFQMIGAVAPAMVADLGIGLTAIGTLVGLFMAPGLLLALPGGLLGQRFGDKTMCLCGFACLTAGGALAAAADGLVALYAGRVLGGVGAAVVMVLNGKMAYDWFAGPRLALAVAVISSAQPVGTGLSLLLFAPLGAAADWRLGIGSTAALAAVALLLTAVVYRRPPDLEPDDAAWSWPSRREIKLVLIAGALFAMFMAPFIAYLSFLPTVLVAEGVAPTRIAISLGLIAWLPLLVIPAGGWIASRGRPDAVILTGIVVWGICAWLVPVLDAPLWLFVIMGLIGSAPAGAIMALPAEVVAPKHRAVALGLFMTVWYAGNTAAPPAAGFLGEIFPDPATPLQACAAFYLTGPLFLWWFRRAQRR